MIKDKSKFLKDGYNSSCIKSPFNSPFAKGETSFASWEIFYSIKFSSLFNVTCYQN